MTVRRAQWKPTPWVFISSVQRGLEAARDAARTACLRARMLPVGMETWAAEARPSFAACVAHLRECDVVLLLVGHRYGSLDPVTGKGFTEIEYDAAKMAGRSVLAFFVRGLAVDASATDPEDLCRLQAFRDKLGGDLRGDANNALQLETLVLQSLYEWRACTSLRTEEAR